MKTKLEGNQFFKRSALVKNMDYFFVYCEK